MDERTWRHASEGIDGRRNAEREDVTAMVQSAVDIQKRHWRVGRSFKLLVPTREEVDLGTGVS
jgi:hypothetical protein